MKYLLIIFLLCGGVFSCKEKKKYEKPKWVERWDSVMTDAKPFLDSVDWSKVDTTRDWTITGDWPPSTLIAGTLDNFPVQLIPKKKSNNVGMSTKYGFGRIGLRSDHCKHNTPPAIFRKMVDGTYDPDIDTIPDFGKKINTPYLEDQGINPKEYESLQGTGTVIVLDANLCIKLMNQIDSLKSEIQKLKNKQ